MFSSTHKNLVNITNKLTIILQRRCNSIYLSVPNLGSILDYKTEIRAFWFVFFYYYISPVVLLKDLLFAKQK